MSYGLKYVTDWVNRQGFQMQFQIYENEYQGGYFNLPPSANPCTATVYGEDDPFAPIRATELRINADVTNFNSPLPAVTTSDDRRYYGILYSTPLAAEGQSVIMWQNFQTSGADYADSNIKISVNGVEQVFAFSNQQGNIVVNAGDNILIELAVFDLVTPPGATWTLQTQKNGINVNIQSTNTPTIGALLTYSFVAENKAIYSTLAASSTTATQAPQIRAASTFILFRGFMLADNFTIKFSSGFKELQMSFTDGLAMLKDIPYPIDESNTYNRLDTLLDTVFNCLDKIDIPGNYFFNSGISIYAQGMADRSDYQEAEPLIQASIKRSDWLGKSCYDVLQDIAQGFGACLFQENGQWTMANIGQRADQQLYLTKYASNTRAIDSGGLFNNFYQIDGYSFGALTPYFINNDQTKRVTKGFNAVTLKWPTKYQSNLFWNADLAQGDTGYDTYKQVELGPTVPTLQIITDPDTGTPIWEATSKGFIPYVGIRNTAYFGQLIGGEKVEFSFEYKSDFQDATDDYIFAEILQFSDLGFAFDKFYTENNQWELVQDYTSSAFTYTENYVKKMPTFKANTEGWHKVTITLDVWPVNANCKISMGGFQWAENKKIYFRNPQLKVVHQESGKEVVSKSYKAAISNEEQYKKVVDINVGGNPTSQRFYSAQMKGILINPATSLPYLNWYRYGVSELEASLIEIIAKQYADAYLGSLVNIDGTVRWLFSYKQNESEQTPMSALSCFGVADNSFNYNVGNNRYFLSNFEIDYTNASIRGTLLQSNNNDVGATVTITNNYGNN